ncbi:MAG: YceI family protein [Agriterribacter sp.]
MKKIFVFLLLCQAIVLTGKAQLYVTKTGMVGFYSKTPLEDIKAENNQVFAAIDLSKKTIVFSMLLKSFLFGKELMQEHFNENYVESDKYPKATFKGTFTGDIDLQKQSNTIQIQGVINLHGTDKQISSPATIEIKDGYIVGIAKLQLIPKDFNITIPSLVSDKIAKQIDVQIKTEWKPVK